MDESFLLAIAGSEAVLFLLIAIVLVRLWRGQIKLKQDVLALTAQLERSSDDVAGLCSAAVAVDKRLATNESRLSDMLETISAPHMSSQPSYDEEPQGYELAIEKIRRGANVEELVKSCGLTRDEAVLLVRLHGR